MPLPVLLVFFAAVAPAPERPDARAIVRQSVEVDQSNWRKLKDYTYVQREDERHSGRVTSKSFEVTTLYGHEFRKLVARDGKPLSGDELAKEQRKYDKEVAERAGESESRRLKKEAEMDKRRQEARAFAREIPDAFDFTVVGEEKVDGRDAWVIDATPRAGFKPKEERAKVLPKLKGRLWIGKADSVWVKADVHVIAPFRWGLFIASLNPGTIIDFVQMRVNDEVWVPKNIKVQLDARLLFKKFDGEYESIFSDFRKFQTETTIVSTSEVQP